MSMATASETIKLGQSETGWQDYRQFRAAGAECAEILVSQILTAVIGHSQILPQVPSIRVWSLEIPLPNFHWHESTGTDFESAPSVGPPSLRTEEMQWIAEHKRKLRKLAGQWIALQGSQLIAHGNRLREVLAESKVKGIEHPLVIRVPVISEEEIAIIV